MEALDADGPPAAGRFARARRTLAEATRRLVTGVPTLPACLPCVSRGATRRAESKDELESKPLLPAPPPPPSPPPPPPVASLSSVSRTSPQPATLSKRVSFPEVPPVAPSKSGSSLFTTSSGSLSDRAGYDSLMGAVTELVSETLDRAELEVAARAARRRGFVSWASPGAPPPGALLF
eukprot:4169292-Prymnesium_polylepis.1